MRTRTRTRILRCLATALTLLVIGAFLCAPALACPPPHVQAYAKSGLMDKYPMGGGTLVCEENDGEGNWMTCRAYNDTTGTGTHLVNVTQRVSGPGVLNLWDTITTASVSLDGREMASTSISQRAWDQYHHPEQAWTGNAPLLLLFSAVATAALVIGLIAYILASRQPPAGK